MYQSRIMVWGMELGTGAEGAEGAEAKADAKRQTGREDRGPFAFSFSAFSASSAFSAPA